MTPSNQCYWLVILNNYCHNAFIVSFLETRHI